MDPQLQGDVQRQLLRLPRSDLEEMAVQVAWAHAAVCKLASDEPEEHSDEHVGLDEIRRRVQRMPSQDLAVLLAGNAWVPLAVQRA